MVCEAFILAERGVELMKLSKQEQVDRKNKLSKKKIKNMKLEAEQIFAKAGRKFQQTNMIREAARCFFSAKMFEAAIPLFKSAGVDSSVAECYEMLGNYRQAA